MSQKHKSSNGDPVQATVRDRAEIMRRLSDALLVVIRKPDTVRMNPIWSCVECEAHRKQLGPEDARKYEFEEEKLGKAIARRKELEAAFDLAHLYLSEDESVLLGRAIKCFPDIWADAWTHIDYVDDETIDKMSDLASRLQFRADTELENRDEKQADQRLFTDAQREAANLRQKIPEHRNKIVKYFKGLRVDRSKAESARLTRKWITRPVKAGGLGVTGRELPSERTIMRWAGEAS